jgi:hypothetical protein
MTDPYPSVPPTAPQPGVYAPAYGAVAPVQNPGRTLGIVGFILAFCGPLTVAGLIVSIVGLVKSRRAQQPNGLALAGTIIGALGTVVGIVVTVLMIIGLVDLVGTCADLGPGTHHMNGITYHCS